jgi:hypothetical protein
MLASAAYEAPAIIVAAIINPITFFIVLSLLVFCLVLTNAPAGSFL